jgi:hypothetical protein
MRKKMVGGRSGKGTSGIYRDKIGRGKIKWLVGEKIHATMMICGLLGSVNDWVWKASTGTACMK